MPHHILFHLLFLTPPRIRAFSLQLQRDRERERERQRERERETDRAKKQINNNKNVYSSPARDSGANVVVDEPACRNIMLMDLSTVET
jgi:hypothetical protein